ncbi:MAG: hypothetical protein KBG28_16300 [Kofleriaceae bacterium]|nr:hypothetical protein [Kofleriaceae bacterium]
MQVPRWPIGLSLLLAACASGGIGKRADRAAVANPGELGRARAIAARAHLGPSGPAIARVLSEDTGRAGGSCVAFTSPVVEVGTTTVGVVEVEDGAALVRTVPVRRLAWIVTGDETYLSPGRGLPAPGAGEPAVFLRRGAMVEVIRRDRDWILVELAEGSETARGWIPVASAAQVGPGRDDAAATTMEAEQGVRVWPLAGQLRASAAADAPALLTTHAAGPFALVSRTEAAALAVYQSATVRALGFITFAEADDLAPPGRDLHRCVNEPPPRRNLPVVHVFHGGERAEVDVPAGVCLRSELDGTVVGITLAPARRTLTRRAGSGWATAWFAGRNFPPVSLQMPTRPGAGPVQIVADCSASLAGRD